MRLHLILPRVEPTVIILPSTCPYKDCDGTHFQHHQGDETTTGHRLSSISRNVTKHKAALRVKQQSGSLV
jgi:hypothetical protein